MQKVLNDIKFLEGSHPELYVKYNKQAESILAELDDMQNSIGHDLAKKAKRDATTKKRKSSGN
jgi:hypothetical protein